VIENEFGEIGIDESLVKRKISSEEEIFEMNNGCLCCTVRSDLIRILKKLAEQKDKFDYVMIETTGLADPGPIVQSFFIDTKLGLQFRLDGVITVVDARHIIQHLDEKKHKHGSNESVEQIEFADRILLNKTDLLPDEKDIDHVIHRIKVINSAAEIIRTQYSNVSLDKILDIKAFDLDRVLQMTPDFLEDDDGHHHDSKVGSIGIELEGTVSYDKVNAWISKFLKEKGADIYRMKGIMSIEGVKEKFVFQGVHMIFDGSPLQPWGEDEKRVNRLVFIGKNLDRAEITKDFKACLVTN